MTKRHYKAIARILHGMNTKESAEVFKSRLIARLSDYFKQSHKGGYSFNSEKFRLACYGREEDE